MADKKYWYAVQDASFDWDAIYNAAVIVKASNSEEAAKLGCNEICKRDGCRPDSVELKVAVLSLRAIVELELNDIGGYEADVAISYA